LFSGVGGLDLGARIAGVEVGLATDIDEHALALLRANNGTPILGGDIDELLSGDLPRAWPSPSQPRIQFGGPPCTAFSHAGFWIARKREGRDPASRYLASYIRALRVFRPDAFVLENVPGLAFKTHRHHLLELLSSVRALGYSTNAEVLSAEAFGVPQTRRRLFVAGVRQGREPDLENWPSFPRRSAFWALNGLTPSANPSEDDEHPGGKYAELLAEVPPGDNYIYFTDRRGYSPPLFRYRGRYWSFLLKMDPRAPAPTIPAQRITYNGPFHWEGRHLRTRELARLQMIPDWYSLSNDAATARRHVGNAVPSLMAAAVIWRVREALGDVEAGTLPLALEVAQDPSADCCTVLDAIPRPR